MTEENPEIPSIVAFPLPDDSHVQTFHLEKANLRGRIVRLGKVLNDILEPHDYPSAVEHLVTEAITLALLLSSMLKYEGTFILQAQGDGAMTRLVADVTSKHEVRATAGFDPDKIAALPADEKMPLNDLMGKGYLAFTVDQGEHMERYQGIVELKGYNLQESIRHYFDQSEQIKTAIKLAVGRDEDGNWRAGAIMLQHMPDHEKIPQDAKPLDDSWERTGILLATCKEEELLDPRLHDDTLLYRLFHEEGVRVYEPQKVSKTCRCSRQKLLNILNMLSPDEILDVTVDGKITSTCEFCNTHYEFTPDELSPKQ